MSQIHVVLDTNIVIAALISRRGKAFELISWIGKSKFDIHLSVPLVLEYEYAIKHLQGTKINLSEQRINNILDFLYPTAHRHSIYYLWRPYLHDPKDDMILELAVRAQCSFIITFNGADFVGVEQFGIKAIEPKAFLATRQ